MHDLTDAEVHEAISRQLRELPSPRFRLVVQRLARHLLDFARDAELEPQEWARAIDVVSHIDGFGGDSSRITAVANRTYSGAEGASTLQMERYLCLDGGI